MAAKVAVPAETEFQSEVAEWIEAFDEVIVAEGPESGVVLLESLRKRAKEAGIQTPGELVTEYRNTIPKHEEVPYPGDRELERKVESLIRWNALAMVHGQNKKDAGIGGHIATYSSLWRWGLITFSTPSMETSPGISSTSRGTRRRACMRGRTWKAALMRSGCCTSAMSCGASRGFRAIRIPGLCRISGGSQRFQWASAR
jgi:hypothetical protein